jgi:hypothetical protein
MFTISIGLSRGMFPEESLGTSHPSPKTHPVSSPSLEADRKRLTGTSYIVSVKRKSKKK